MSTTITSRPKNKGQSIAPKEFIKIINALKVAAHSSKYEMIDLKECPTPERAAEFAVAISAQTSKATGRIVFLYSPCEVKVAGNKVKVVIFAESSLSDEQMFNKKLAKDIWAELSDKTKNFKVVKCGISKTADEYFANNDIEINDYSLHRINGIEINLSWFTNEKPESIDDSFRIFANIIMSMSKEETNKSRKKITN